MIIVRLLSPGPWLVGTTKVYSGVGADIVMESITLIEYSRHRLSRDFGLLPDGIIPSLHRWGLWYGRAIGARVRGSVVHLGLRAVSYTHLRAHETRHDLVCRLL